MSMRVCSVPGCPTIYEGKSTRCPDCQATADRARGTATQRGYTGAGHQAFRGAVLTRDPVCVVCNVRQSTVADHHPLSRKDLTLNHQDPNNPAYGRGLCKPCHDSATASHQPGGWHTH